MAKKSEEMHLLRCPRKRKTFFLWRNIHANELALNGIMRVIVKRVQLGGFVHVHLG